MTTVMAAGERIQAMTFSGTAEAKDRVVTVLRTTRPLSGWLATEVGPSLAPERAR